MIVRRLSRVPQKAVPVAKFLQEPFHPPFDPPVKPTGAKLPLSKGELVLAAQTKAIAPLSSRPTAVLLPQGDSEASHNAAELASLRAAIERA